jgi:hypothetical protein
MAASHYACESPLNKTGLFLHITCFRDVVPLGLLSPGHAVALRSSRTVFGAKSWQFLLSKRTVSMANRPQEEVRTARAGSARGPSILKKRDRAFECFPHSGGITTAAHPSPAHIEELLKRVMPFPIPNKQINRQDEPLITTVLRCFQIAFGYSFLQLQERA